MTKWFYKTGNKSIGPIDEDTIRQWIKQGAIAPSQLVRPDSSQEWKPANQYLTDLMSTARVPDLLGKVAAQYFEAEGFCFMPVLEAVGGRCRVNLFYQSRFSRSSRAKISLAPRAQGFWPQDTGLTPIKLQIDCAGGEFGVVRLWYPVPAGVQGGKAAFDVSGEATYPDGKGDMIRFRSGIRVFEPKTAATRFAWLAMFVAGIHVFRKDAAVTCALPRPVAEVIPEGSTPEQEILWSLSAQPAGIGDTHPG